MIRTNSVPNAPLASATSPNTSKSKLESKESTQSTQSREEVAHPSVKSSGESLAEAQEIPSYAVGVRAGYLPARESRRGKLIERLAKCGVVFFAIAWLVLMASRLANAAPRTTAQSEDEEYSFKWLDPEKKIYVLQNRRYQKANRVLLSLMVGPGISNSYRSTYEIEPRFAYYFREDLGVEFFYTKGFNSPNNTFRALVQAVGSGGPYPVVREMDSQFGALVHWVPWYSKINVFNKILYFDWYFSGGLGQMRTNLSQNATGAVTATEQLFSFFLGTGHQYFITESMAFRINFQGTFYRAPIYGTSGDSVYYSNYSFGLGLGWRL